MSVLYLDRRDLRLSHEGKALVIHQGDHRQGTVPMGLLERVVVRGNVRLDTGVLGELAESGIGVLLLSGRYSRNLAMIVGRPHKDAMRRVAQVRCYDDMEWRLRWSRRLIGYKLRGQERLLRHALGQRPDCRLRLLEGVQALQELRARLRGEGERLTIDQIRGLEGAGAAAYFAAYTQLFAPSLAFHGRNRRPPLDPVNACLSLAYTLAHAETSLALYMAGLDPLLGFFHTPDYGRESLASDVVELVRPVVDRWVWGLFRDRELRVEHFRLEPGACLMGKAGRGIFYTAFEPFFRPWRRGLRRIALHIARQVLVAGTVETMR